MSKLELILKSEGFTDSLELLEEMITESVVPSICMNKGCDYITGMEPGQTEGWCEECQINTVQSCMILAGVI